MLRFIVKLVVLITCVLPACMGCSCANRAAACEYLRADVAFVGRVTEIVPAQIMVLKDMPWWGYSMRFKVEISLAGQTANEITIETGRGGGDCGTPLLVGQRALIFASKARGGTLLTGLCSGNQILSDSPESENIVKKYVDLAKTVTIFGRVDQAKPVWHGDHIEDNSGPEPVSGLILRAESEKFSASTKTAADGTYEFDGLPTGKYTVVPEHPVDLDFDHGTLQNRYQADLIAGQCASIRVKLEPITRIRGRLIVPPGAVEKSLEVDAVPTHLENLQQFAGTSVFTDENNRFDLWPLPPGDYYIGVNINSLLKENPAFPPTYYPGVTDKRNAVLVHVAEGEVKEVEISLPAVAAPVQ
jgi:hypothetical protein